ncbi:hypothetical protein ACFQ09_08180 [Massilia norwichensis]|jgi:hypothetical protein|uniref:Transmembrane protein n=1 Tax=Massilia norwichensis TaxID=1442366 RepID=A0ABT2AC23_9BURK|nr:hypothetical protein [Massilia norwichensis]MCS0591697.1 hypothetical protein [Massilia norwichensis]
MNSVTHNIAGTKAGLLARCALRGALACVLMAGSLGAAFAQQYGDRQFDRRDSPAMQADRGDRGDRGGRYLSPERDPRYDVRAYEEQRRMQQQYQQQQQEQRDVRRSGSGRMTPDERREMRRQINEAGMDLYPPRR